MGDAPPVKETPLNRVNLGSNARTLVAGTPHPFTAGGREVAQARDTNVRHVRGSIKKGRTTQRKHIAAERPPPGGQAGGLREHGA